MASKIKYAIVAAGSILLFDALYNRGSFSRRVWEGISNTYNSGYFQNFVRKAESQEISAAKERTLLELEQKVADAPEDIKSRGRLFMQFSELDCSDAVRINTSNDSLIQLLIGDCFRAHKQYDKALAAYEDGESSKDEYGRILMTEAGRLKSGLQRIRRLKEWERKNGVTDK